MSSRVLRFDPSRKAAPKAGQKSPVNPLDLIAGHDGISRHQATVFWADLVARRCRSREECAVLFGVTFQTACNWFDGFSCPTGAAVLNAVRMWPDEFMAMPPALRVAA